MFSAGNNICRLPLPVLLDHLIHKVANTFLQEMKKFVKHLSLIKLKVLSTLGFATMVIAAKLGIATATPFTDLCHYIIATLDITTSNFGPYVAK